MRKFGVITIRKPNQAEQLFYLAYIPLLLLSLYTTTTFIALYNPDILRTVIRLFATLVIAFKIIFYDKFNGRQLVLIIVLMVLATIAGILSGRFYIFEAALVIVGSKGIDKKSVVKLFFFVGVVFLSITILFSLTGIIENYVTTRSGSNILRYSFGCVYSTDFAAHIFYLILAYHYIREHKINVFDIIVHVAIILLLAIFCDARLTEIMIVITMVGFLLYDYRQTIFKSKAFSWITILITLISAAFSILITMLYSNSNLIMMGIDNFLFSGRLRIAKKVIDNYGFSLFGQYIKMQGQGFSLSAKDNELGTTFLDSSYLQFILSFGIVLFVIIMVCYTISVKRACESNNIKLEIIFVIIAIACIWNQFLFKVEYNPFIILVGVYLMNPRVREKKKQVISDSPNSRLGKEKNKWRLQT